MIIIITINEGIKIALRKSQKGFSETTLKDNNSQ